MKVYSCAFLMVAIAAVCFGAPMTQFVDENPELSAGYLEGDMVVDSWRTGLRNESRRWPNKIVYYKISDGFFAEEHLNQILRGMRIIEDASCIRFREAPVDKTDFVLITGNSDGCYSSVGYLNRQQTYNLALNRPEQGCFRMGTVVHEFLHTLGFFHMQSASNRDEYVLIKEENIQDGTQNNFDKYSENDIDDYGEEYDYGSVMHYPATAFSKNGEPTIVALKPVGGEQMGQRRGMSKSDISRLNIMYRCPLTANN